MTVIIVSLFLPYTINFAGKGANGSTAQQATSETAHKEDGPIPNLMTSKTLPLAPKEDSKQKDDGYFFFRPSQSQQTPGVESAEPGPGSALKQVDTNVQNALAFSDPHSPAWGSSMERFVQPLSRASSPPPQSILQHLRQEVSKLTGSLDSKSSRLRHEVVTEEPEEIFGSGEWTVEPAIRGNGGLRNAVKAVSADGSLDEYLWVGTLGMPTDALEGQTVKNDIETKLFHEYNSVVVFCKDSDFDSHYSHYSKQILWPVFHYQIPDNPKSKAYEDHSWEYYEKVNRDFADKIIETYKRGDIIWIHDYHLLLVPAMVREKLPDAKIGFFLHVAFPSSEVFRCLAMRKELLEGVLGSNLIGFQTEEYVRHFLQTCSRLLYVEASKDGIELDDRIVNVTSLAIGIDPISLDKRRQDVAVKEWIASLLERYEGKRLLVARDKLDHIRGVRQKLLAYELFLNKYPQWKGQVVLIQVATSTTGQAELDATVSDIVTRVNSQHSTLAHQPLVFLKQDISYQQYLALLTVADALMITSLREGMNLTSHEYIFCQDGKYGGKKHGPLILSEFTGSASVFNGAELSVNPWDYHQCARAILVALDMSPSDKETRWKKLYAAVMHQTAAFWFSTLVEKLDESCQQQQSREMISIPRLSVPSLSKEYQRAKRRFFVLDYEGTLAPKALASDTILTSPQRTLDALNELIQDSNNTVYVMSGSAPPELDSLFRRVSGLGLIAENGFYVREAGSEDWQAMADKEQMTSWKNTAMEILNFYRERVPGTTVEERLCSVIFHYENADDPEHAVRQAGECANHINESGDDNRVHAINIDGAVVVESRECDKSTSASKLFEKLRKEKGDIDFLLVAGDTREDEVVFKWANALAKDGTVKSVTTIAVGSRSTEAMATSMQGVTGMQSALQSLARSVPTASA